MTFIYSTIIPYKIIASHLGLYVITHIVIPYMDTTIMELHHTNRG